MSAVVERALRQLSWFSLPVAVCIALVAAWFMSRRLTHPLVAISDTVQAIAHGQLGRRVHHRAYGEIGMLAQGVNSMSLELARLFSSLSDEKRRTESILAHMSEGVLSIDLDKAEAVYNTEAALILGLPMNHSDVLGRCPSTELIRIVQEREVISVIEATIQENSVQRKTVQLQRNQIFQITASPLCSDNERASGAVVLLLDISQRHRLEQSQREFFASISHDLRTPLTVLRGLLQAVKDQLVTDPEEIEGYIDCMHSQVLHLISLTSTLLEIARLNMESSLLNRELVSLSELVTEHVALLEPLIEEKQVTVITEGMDLAPTIYLDKEKMGRVVYNLLENAVFHSPQGGMVVIGLKEDGHHLELSVSDQGLGITPGEEQQVFQPFYKEDLGRSSSSNGPGLGLAIVKSLVELHNGTVQACNRLAGGAEFLIRLPLSRG
jgi:signal transduction histidine kinase